MFRIIPKIIIERKEALEDQIESSIRAFNGKMMKAQCEICEIVIKAKSSFSIKYIRMWTDFEMHHE